MNFKPGVTLGPQLSPHAVLAMVLADQIYRECGAECTVTSVADGKHSATSLHYVGRAIDLRTHDLTPNARVKIALRLKGRLRPLGFDVIDEGDHFHVEYDPKGG